ncbi:hypothetical protein LINPERPRIM_LOCUS4822 [Linum perenne]
MVGGGSRDGGERQLVELRPPLRGGSLHEHNMFRLSGGVYGRGKRLQFGG